MHLVCVLCDKLGWCQTIQVATSIYCITLFLRWWSVMTNRCWKLFYSSTFIRLLTIRFAVCVTLDIRLEGTEQVSSSNLDHGGNPFKTNKKVKITDFTFYLFSIIQMNQRISNTHIRTVNQVCFFFWLRANRRYVHFLSAQSATSCNSCSFWTTADATFL